jgi:hypothetical protein
MSTKVFKPERKTEKKEKKIIKLGTYAERPAYPAPRP